MAGTAAIPPAYRFADEWHDAGGNWFRSHGNENWEFAEDGPMAARRASIDDRAIPEGEGLLRWPRKLGGGRRPDDHSGLSELGL